MRLKDKINLLYRIMTEISISVNLNSFNHNQLEEISSVLSSFCCIIVFYLFSAFAMVIGQNNIAFIVFVLTTIFLILYTLYLKYLIIHAKDEYNKRQKNRENYSEEHNVNFYKDTIRITVNDAIGLDKCFDLDSGLHERQNCIKLEAFLDGVFYVFNYLINNKNSKFEWLPDFPGDPRSWVWKYKFNKDKSFIEQIVEYGAKKIQEAEKKDFEEKNFDTDIKIFY